MGWGLERGGKLRLAGQGLWDCERGEAGTGWTARLGLGGEGDGETEREMGGLGAGWLGMGDHGDRIRNQRRNGGSLNQSIYRFQDWKGPL